MYNTRHVMMKRKRKIKIIDEGSSSSLVNASVVSNEKNHHDTCAICLNPVKERRTFAVRNLLSLALGKTEHFVV